MSRVWTEQQCAVLNGKGRMIVSASAGSGKTAVMIEKMTNLILNGVKVEQILAMTFTRAAAQEMKERLQCSLQKAILSTQDKELQEHLKRELEEIEGATITTIDSFCNTLIQKNFFRLEGVDPNFTILTEENDWLKKLQNRAMQAALQDWLSAREVDRYIDDFCKIFAKNGSFQQVQELLLEGYNTVRHREKYLAFIQEMPTFYTAENFEILSKQHFQNCKARLQKLAGHLTEIYTDFCEFKDILKDKFFEYILAITNFCKGGYNCKNYDELVTFAANFTIENKPKYVPSKNTDVHIVEKIKSKNEQLKQLLEVVKETKQQILFYQDRERAMHNFYYAGQLTAAFCKLMLIFDGYFTKQKRAVGKLEFIDLPHLTNQLLQEDTVKIELQEQYKYLFIDEYQDTSPIQESILQKLDIQNFCMVGDLKQSIYGFRGCAPEIMQQKMQDKERYTVYQLNQNFRSKYSIICLVNNVFEKILPYYEHMQSNIEVESTEGVYSYSYLPKEKEEEDCHKVYSVLENLTPVLEITPEGELAYAIICAYIARMQKEKSPQECYNDIVLLTRTRDKNIEKIIYFLAERGIPITTDAEVNICIYPEIQELCNILEFIDNRQQDIPLVATLKSAMIGMTDEELITIKENTTSKTFFLACREYVTRYTDSIAEKLLTLDLLATKLQTMAKVKSCSEILEYLLIHKELELSFLTSAGKNDAKYATNQQKLLRIERLLETAADCSVAEFLQKLRLQEGKILYKQSGGQNTVQIMTVHQSKGLEFPVVILVGLENALARNEKQDKFKFDSQYGFYFDAYDTKNFTMEKTILSRLARDRQIEKAIEDQKRVFYVAMTRAKKELHILINKKKEKREELKEYLCFREFLLDAQIEKYDRTAEVIVAMGTDFLKEREQEQGQRVLQLPKLTEAEIVALGRDYQKRYPYAAACTLPIKSSATALRALEGVAVEEHKERRLFTAGENILTGLAYHAFLEHVAFCTDTAEKWKEIDRVYNMLSAEYQKVLDKEKMLQILNLPIFQIVQNAVVYKEKRFLLQANVNEIEVLNTDIEDSFLLQGVIDLLVQTKEEITIVDYKYSSHTMQQLVKDYRQQMQIYKMAVQKWQPTKKIICYILNIKNGEFMQVDF